MMLRRIALAVALTATLAACNKSSEPAPAGSPAPAAAASAAPAESPAPAPAEAAPAGEAVTDPVKDMEALAASSTGAPLGIPECDDYLTKYEACVASKVPEATRETLANSLKATREAWRQSLTTPGAEAALASACTQAREAAKPSLQAYGCTDM
jgi:hypothetical protein